jgi:nucleoside phosphorylase
MVHIFCALEEEAYAVRTLVLSNVSVYVTGVGVTNMFKAVKRCISSHNNEDTYLNVGVCGASIDYPIGSVINLTSPDFLGVLTCVRRVASAECGHTLVDMESKGFLLATKGIKKVGIVKVVSDHFDSSVLNKEYIRSVMLRSNPELHYTINNIITKDFIKWIN